MRSSLSIAAVCAAISVIMSCSAPSVTRQFMRKSSADSVGRYSFVLDMSDSLSVYDISLYFRLDTDDAGFEAMGDIPVAVTFESPDGRMFGENVYVPKSSLCSRSHFAHDYDVGYRKGVSPSVYGRWVMRLSVDDSLVAGFRGIGVRLEKK